MKPSSNAAAIAAIVAGFVLVAFALLYRTKAPVPPPDRPKPRQAQQIPMASSGAVPGFSAPSREAAQPASDRIRVNSTRSPGTGVFGQFSAWIDEFLASNEPAASEGFFAQGEELAQMRRKELKDLIEANPRQALVRAVPEDVRARLPARIQRHLEERISDYGEYRVSITCLFGEDGTHSEDISRKVTIGERTFKAFVYGHWKRQITQENILVRGIAVDRSLAVLDDMESSGRSSRAMSPSGTHRHSGWAGDAGGSGSVGPRRSANSSLTQGTKRLLFMRVAFSDDTSEPISESAASALMEEVNRVFQEYSYNTTAIISDITPLLILPNTKTSYQTKSRDDLQDDARAAALAAGYDTDNYDLDIVRNNVVGGNLNFGGQADVGSKGLIVQFSGLFFVVHELGHNYGLWHANSWNASGDGIIGPGSTVEYGNPFDTMANPGSNSDSFLYQFGSWSKYDLQWLPSSFVHTITSSGQYRVFAFDVPNLNGGQKYAFRIYKDYAREYWGEYRIKFSGNAWTQSGIILNWTPFDNAVGDTLSGTVLLDTTPGTPASNSGRDDAPVVIGRTFSDVSAGIHITPVAKGTSGSDNYIDVQVNLGTFSGNTAPTLSISANQTSVATSTSVTFTATASDTDGDTLAYDWDFGDQTFGSNSASASKSWSTAGEYVVRCTVSDMKGGVASRNVVITVGSPVTLRVSGQVTVGGQALQGVRIHNGGSGSSYRGVYSDSSGNFTLANLSAGALTLSAVKYGYTLAVSGFSNPITLVSALTGHNWTATQIPVLSVSASDASASESGSDTGTFTVARSGSLSSSITMNFNLSGGATFSTDYSLSPSPGGTSPRTLTMSSGVASTSITLTPVDDSAFEGPETAVFTIHESTAYTLGSVAESTITIADNEAASPPSVTVTAFDDAATESGSDTGVFKFTRSNVGTSALTVNYSVSGTASGGVDYVALSGSTVIAAGATEAFVAFTAIDDAIVEGNETVIATVSAGTGYNVGSPSSATVTIGDDDPPTVAILATDSTAAESGGSGTFTVTRTGSLAANLVVSYTMSGSATSGLDYTAPSGSLTIVAGKSSASFNLFPINDTAVEGNETATAVLSSSPVYNVGNPGSASVLIADNDIPSITLTAQDNTAAEASTATGFFRFTRSGSTSGDLTVHYGISGTAFQTADYTLSGGTFTSIVIPDGSSSADLTVTPVDDSIKENTETVVATLQSSPNSTYTVTTTSGQTVNITDNDSSALPGLSWETTSSSSLEGQAPQFLDLSFKLSSGAPSPFARATISFGSGTATAGGVDYTQGTTALTVIASGATSAAKNGVLTTVGDTIVESDETVLISVVASFNCQLDTANTVHTHTIIDDDGGSGTITVAATDSSAAESGASTGTFRISRSGFTTSSTTVSYQIVGSASSPSDFAALSGSATIPSGSSFVDLTVTPVDDSTPEASETVVISLTRASEGTIGMSKTATITISDNDTAPPVVSITATDAIAFEPGSLNTGTFTLTRTGSTAADLTVNFTVAGTATSGTDYSSIGTSKVILAGSSSALVTVTPLSDALTEGSETVIVTLTVSGPYQADPGASAATVTIDDPPPTVSVSATDALAFEPGTNTGTFTVTRTGATTSALTVNFTVGGTAASGSDYSSIGTSLTIPASASSATVTVTPLSDAVTDASETVVLTLAASGSYEVDSSASSATVTIEDSGGDYDGDGFTNLQESIAGTDPANSTSALGISTIEEGSGSFAAQFTTVSGKQYRFEGNNSGPAGTFGTIGSDQNGDGNLLAGTDTATAAQSKGFYRVRVLGGGQGDVLSRMSGFYRVTLLGNSDTRVSIPFARPEAAFAAAVSVSGNVITTRGAPAWSSSQWVYEAGVRTNSHYLQIRSGTLEGQYHPITANGANTITVDLEGQSLTGLSVGDRVAIVPYWTLGSIFPAGEGVHTSPSAGDRQTEILLPDIGGVGINLSSASTYYFISGNWNKVGDGSTAHNDTVLLPDAYFIVRHNVATSTTLTTRGGVLGTKWRVQVMRNALSRQDNVLALPRPVETSLDDSGLIESGAFSASPTPGDRTDELLVFDSAQAAKNKAPSATYYYWNGAWRKVGAGATDVGDDNVFVPGTGVIIRKAAGTGTTVWSNSANF